MATQVAPGGELPAQIGKYPVIRKLGEGATSDVFLCRDEFHDREVAVNTKWWREREAEYLSLDRK